MRARFVIALLGIVAVPLVWLALRQRSAPLSSPPSPVVAAPLQTSITGSNAAASPSRNAAWLNQLYSRGDASVPEICEFLHRGQDDSIDTADPSRAWATFTTVRTALLALLGEIGSADALACVRDVALSTPEPFELALAARVLEERQPNQHRDELIDAARRLLAQHPANATPLLQLLAYHHVTDAIPEIEELARTDTRNTPAAIQALGLMRRDRAVTALARLWQQPDLSAENRVLVLRAVGAAAANSEFARVELARLYGDAAATPQSRREALQAVAGPEPYPEPRLLPRTEIAAALPSTKWLTARLEVLDVLEPLTLDAQVAGELQRTRDKLLQELEMSQ